jgi:hypothetical protein
MFILGFILSFSQLRLSKTKRGVHANWSKGERRLQVKFAFGTIFFAEKERIGHKENWFFR